MGHVSLSRVLVIIGRNQRNQAMFVNIRLVVIAHYYSDNNDGGSCVDNNGSNPKLDGIDGCIQDSVLAFELISFYSLVTFTFKLWLFKCRKM